MPAGMTILVVVAALIYFGVAQRMLDKMRLTDTQALLFIGLMVAGSFITIPLLSGRTSISLNIGGSLVPLGIVIYLLTTADSAYERVRALIASVVSAAIIFGIAQYTDFDPSSGTFIDPLWLFSIISGIVGYLAGRSRRAAFIAGVLGILLTDLVHAVRAWLANMNTRTAIGGAGVFDAMIVAGIIAVALAEIVGETRERLSGGPGVPSQGEKEGDD
ncbi:MAG: DUF1614 domain-containing protein [Firmicutes bacterium]|jgi:uncharacterized membrane protein|nr:DUF1614 domain-containing protein [Bacillota bacterium]HHT72592.1 DUF1614 domain-containing protein [Bacillota bacterium]